MNALLKIFLYLLVSVFVGALLAPLFYKLILLVPTSHFGKTGVFLYSVQQMPFHRYASRSIQIVAFLLLWPTIASLKIKQLSDLFLYHNEHARSDFWKGVVIALVPIWLLEALFIKLQWYSFEGGAPLKIILRILVTALAVAFLEEFLFRGVLLGLCRRFLKDVAALAFVAFLFAGVHFLNFSHAQEITIHWWSGFSLLLHHNTVFSDSSLMVGAFITLFFLGLILGWATIRTESLWLSIGLHGGWIFAQQGFRAITQQEFSGLMPWWGPSQIYGMVPVGLLVFLPLGVTLILIKKFIPQQKISSSKI